MELFKIGEYDVTPHIVVPTYKINKLPKYEDWEDANYTTHREVVRHIVSGTFTVKFWSIAEFEEFITAVDATLMNDGSHHIYAYVANDKTNQSLQSTYAFIEFDLEHTLPIIGTEDDDGFEVTITER